VRPTRHHPARDDADFPTAAGLWARAGAAAIMLPLLVLGCDPAASGATRERPLPPLSVAPEGPSLASVLGEKARLTALKSEGGSLGTLESEGVGRLTCEALEVKV
jgi:hypothetical protein